MLYVFIPPSKLIKNRLFNRIFRILLNIITVKLTTIKDSYFIFGFRILGSSIRGGIKGVCENDSSLLIYLQIWDKRCIEKCRMHNSQCTMNDEIQPKLNFLNYKFKIFHSCAEKNPP